MPAGSQVANPGEGTVIMGAYKGLWNDLDIGNTLDGFRFNCSESAIPIVSDITGSIVVDELHTGINLSITMVLQHWNAQAIEPMIWWHGNSVPADYEWGLTDGAGQSKWEAAKPLILYACDATGFALAGTSETPSTITPSTGASASNPYIDPLDITFFKAILQKDQNLEIQLANQPRFLELTLDIFPVANATLVGSEVDEFDPALPDAVIRPNGCGKLRFFHATRGASPSITP